MTRPQCSIQNENQTQEGWEYIWKNLRARRTTASNNAAGILGWHHAAPRRPGWLRHFSDAGMPAEAQA